MACADQGGAGMSAAIALTVVHDVNEQHRLARQSAESAVQHAIRCGELLASVKAKLPHGEFENWVRTSCAFAPRTAQAYMQAAQKRNSVAHFNSLRQVLGYESKPKSRPEPPAAEPPVSVVIATESAPAAIGESAPEPPAVPAAAAPDPDFDFEGYEPEDDAEYRQRVESVMMADDKLAALREELQASHRELAAVKSSRDHYQAQSGQAVRLLKAEQSKVAALEKKLIHAEDELERLRERIAIMEES